jgi:hypothetical protein
LVAVCSELAVVIGQLPIVFPAGYMLTCVFVASLLLAFRYNYLVNREKK